MSTSTKQTADVKNQAADNRSPLAVHTGDTLSKREHEDQITAPVRQPLSAYAGTSIIKNFPPADVDATSTTTKTTLKDYQAAKDTILLLLARYTMLSCADAFLEQNLRTNANIIESYNDEQATVNQTTATGGGAPWQDTSTGQIDANPIPISSTTTTDPTIQPADPVIPDAPVGSVDNTDNTQS